MYSFFKLKYNEYNEMLRKETIFTEEYFSLFKYLMLSFPIFLFAFFKITYNQFLVSLNLIFPLYFLFQKKYEQFFWRDKIRSLYQSKGVIGKYIMSISSLIFLFYTLGLSSKIVEVSYKILIFILIGLILLNTFYKNVIKFIRRNQIKKIIISTGLIVIGLLLLNPETTIKIGVLSANLMVFSKDSTIKLYNIYPAILYLYMLILVCFMFRSIKIKNKKGQKEKKDKYLLSFREEELKKITEIVNDKGIPSILIDAKMGNGKTRLIDNFIDNNTDVIYYKLPFVKDLEEFKINLFSEIKRIFLKYDIDNRFLNDFFNKVSIFKTSFFEIGVNKKSNNWENIKKLKEGLKKIDSYTNVVIILDDIEREDNAQKTKDIVCFLGELSEYFKDTTVTILFLAESKSLKKQFSKSEDGLEEELEKKLEKYVRYEIKLKEPKINELSQEDMEKIFDEVLEKNSNNIIDKKYKKITIEMVDIFFKALKNEETNENFRNLTRAFNKIIFYKELIKRSRFLYTIFLFGTLSDIFSLKKILDDKKYNEVRKEYYSKSFSSKKGLIDSYFFNEEIKKIEEIYFKNEFINEKFESEVNIILNILNGHDKTSSFEVRSIHEDFLYDSIGTNKEKFIIGIDRELIKDKNLLIKKILEINEDYNSSTWKKIEEILLYPTRGYLDELYDEEAHYYDMLEKENEVIDVETVHRLDSQKVNQQLLKNLKKFNMSDEKLKEIENVLDQDTETVANDIMYFYNR